jgi:hypothetical protein
MDKAVRSYRNLLLEHFKDQSFTVAFAYGSAVFPQSAQADASAMIDCLVVVDEKEGEGTDALRTWHEKRAAECPWEYPWLNGGLAARIFKDAVYFVPGSQSGTATRLKYGVMRASTLLNDLWTWKSLYLAGRLHKPTLLIPGSQDGSTATGHNNTFMHELGLAMEYNWDCAARMALLLGRDGDGLTLLLERIVSLSYRGDLRTLLAESPDKIQNIVKHQYRLLAELYEERLASIAAAEDRPRLIGNLPWPIGQRLAERLGSSDPAVLAAKAHPRDFDAVLRTTVAPMACLQSALGLLSSPPLTAVTYLFRKLRKRWS